jgi:hypothetical protein
MLSGAGTHYFIESVELADLIISMVKEVTIDVIDVFHETRNTAHIIHPPSPLPAVLCSILTFPGPLTNVVFWKGTDGSVYNNRCFTEHIRFRPTKYQDRLAIGLALYLRFFPEAVRDGLPDSAKHPAHYRGRKCTTISTAKELIDRSGPIPHLRTAHYRFLGSDRFVHKKGTVILVRECMVKGKCKVVVEVES